MKPQLIKVSVEPTASFSARRDEVPYFLNRWHFHPELELVYIEKGTGTQFVGDSIKRFKEGDMILIGANLPHYWRCDEQYFKGDPNLHAKAMVVHFKEDFWGKDFLFLPENKKIKQLLKRAEKGIQVPGQLRKSLSAVLEAMIASSETMRIVSLLDMLYRIATSPKLITLSSEGFGSNATGSDHETINEVYTYSIENFKNKITIREISGIAHVSPNSFCRYFKSRTKKNYLRFLQELRVGYACKLLIENKLTPAQICYESGFNNIVNFHRYFKLITGKTPHQYKTEYLANYN